VVRPLLRSLVLESPPSQITFQVDLCCWRSAPHSDFPFGWTRLLPQPLSSHPHPAKSFCILSVTTPSSWGPPLVPFLCLMQPPNFDLPSSPLQETSSVFPLPFAPLCRSSTSRPSPKCFSPIIFSIPHKPTSHQGFGPPLVFCSLSPLSTLRC